MWPRPLFASFSVTIKSPVGEILPTNDVIVTKEGDEIVVWATRD